MTKKIILIFVSVYLIFIGSECNADQTITARKVNISPVVDGAANDQLWANAETVVTRDKLADIDIYLKAVYTDTKIFFLVRFPDPNESRTHKSWQWNPKKNLYDIGKDREDSFVFKWNNGSDQIDLSIYADNNYIADIWYWKANRTDPMGYADDKSHVLSNIDSKDATKVTSRTGRNRYLLRPADKGKSAYESQIQIVRKDDTMARYKNRKPTLSRADVKAKGIWKDGWWTIELARDLDTGFDDDIQFITSKKFQFGVCRFEIAGRDPDPKSSQPLHGAGDVSEVLTLTFSN